MMYGGRIKLEGGLDNKNKSKKFKLCRSPIRKEMLTYRKNSPGNLVCQSRLDPPMKTRKDTTNN